MKKAPNTNQLIIILILGFMSISSMLAQTGHWELLNPKNHPSMRFNHDMASIGQNLVLLYGGYGSKGYLNDTWIFNLKTNEWDSITCSNSPKARSLFSMTQISENKILLFGGVSDSGYYNSDLWIFDLDSLNWNQLFPINSTEARSEHRIVKLNDNEVMIFGGRISFANHTFFTDDVRIYNIIKNEWSKIINPFKMPKERARFMMCQIKENEVFLFGGWALNYYGDNWFYHFQSNTWDTIPLLNNDIFPIYQGDMK